MSSTVVQNPQTITLIMLFVGSGLPWELDF